MIKNRTPVGDLSGSVTNNITKVIQYATSAPATSCTGQATDWTTVTTIGVTVSESANEVFLRAQSGFRLSSGNSQSVRIIRDGNTGDVIASTVTGVTQSGTWTLEVTLNDEAVGTRNYQVQIKMTSGQAETCCLENLKTHYILSESIDTHAGSAKPLNNVILG